MPCFAFRMADFEQNPFVYFFLQMKIKRSKEATCNLLFFAEMRRQGKGVCTDPPDRFHCCTFILDRSKESKKMLSVLRLAIRCRQHVTFHIFCWKVRQKCFRVVSCFPSGIQRLQTETWSGSAKGKTHRLIPFL